MKDIRAVPEREATTQLQVQNLLNIAGTMMAALLVPNHNISEPHHSKPELDGGCKSAAEMTFIESCNALTDILRDKSRWSLEVTKVLELQAVKLNQYHIDVLTEQKKALAAMNTPSYRFHPELVRTSDGMYCAYLGDIDNPEASLVGIGKTAEAAFHAFDELFSGRIPNEMVSYLLAQEERLKQKHEKELDETRTQRPKKRKTSRSKPRRDSDSTSPNENSGGSAG